MAGLGLSGSVDGSTMDIPRSPDGAADEVDVEESAVRQGDIKALRDSERRAIKVRCKPDWV